MIEVDCILCRGRRTRYLFEMKDRIYQVPGTFRLVSCQDCGLVYMNPQPGGQKLVNCYPEDYGCHVDYSRADKVSSSVDSRKSFYLRGQGCLLEVGCGNGNFLKRLQNTNPCWTLKGVEPNPRAASRASESGLEVRCGTLEEVRFEDSSFDVVMMRSVIEHLTNPRNTMEEVRRIMRGNGLAYIKTPNVDSLNFRLFGANWFHLDAPRHLWLFSPLTFNRLCDNTGFELKQVRYDSGMRGLLESINYRRQEQDLAPMTRRGQKFLKRVGRWPWRVVDLTGFGDVITYTIALKN